MFPSDCSSFTLLSHMGRCHLSGSRWRLSHLTSSLLSTSERIEKNGRKRHFINLTSSSEDPRLPAEISEVHRENSTFKMHCSRCVLPLLALYLLLDEVSAAVSPRQKREANWLDQDLSRLPDQPDLSVGDAGDVIRHVDSPASHSENDRISPIRQHLNQSQRKANEKRRKVARLDSIGSFQMSNTQNRKDEPDVYWGDE